MVSSAVFGTAGSAGRTASERSFGFLFAGMFAAYGVWPVFHGHPPRLWAVVLGGALLAVGAQLYASGCWLAGATALGSGGAVLGSAASVLAFTNCAPPCRAEPARHATAPGARVRGVVRADAAQ